MHRFPQARGALPLNTFLSADQADAIEDGNDRVQINGAITLNFTIDSGVKNGPTEFCTGGPFVADRWLELLLFCGIALHVKLISFSPRLTTLRATGVPRLTSPRAGVVAGFTTPRAGVVPRLTTLLPAGGLFLTLLHTGHWLHWLSGRCRSGWCRSGWLHLSLSI
jgi:hypothetical protein